MDMEVDESNNTAISSDINNALFVCCIMKKVGLRRVKVSANLHDLSLENLKIIVFRELETWEWAHADDKPQNIDILHRSRVVATDDDAKKIGHLSVVTVIKKEPDASIVKAKEDQHKSPAFIAEYAASRHVHDQLTQVALALRTAFFNPKFITMVENLGNSEMLENIFAIASELRTDPVGIAVIQDPTLIYHLSDPDSLKKLANTKPWVIEAFNFMAASIHQEKGNQPQGIPSHLFNQSLFDGEDESMEDDEDDGNAPGPSRAGSRITREQLSAALTALGGGSAAASSVLGGGLPSSNAFGGLFQSSQQQQTSTQNPGATTAGANIQNLMNTLAGAAGGASGQSLSSDMVARAVTDALRRLTPEQRADQLSAIRNFASQLQNQPNQPVGSIPPMPQTPQPPAQQAIPTASTASQEYQSQLRQMRDLGITDERLSILALRVSEGDVNTAAELIFSGWQGEGSDPIN